MKKYILTGLILMSCFVVLSGCGNNDIVSAPYDGSITIATSDYTVASGDGSTVTQYRKRFLITVKNANGIPLDDVSLRISFIWAESDPGFPYALYYDIYNLDTSTCDKTVPLVQLLDFDGNTYTPKSQPMDVKTDKDGTYELWVGFLLGGFDLNCDGIVDTVPPDDEPVYFEYYADIEVTSGSLYAKVKFTVEGPG